MKTEITYSLRKIAATIGAMFLAASAMGASTNQWQYPQINSNGPLDLFFISEWSGTTYSTKNIPYASLLTEISAAVSGGTNAVTVAAGTNITVTTNTVGATTTYTIATSGSTATNAIASTNGTGYSTRLVIPTTTNLVMLGTSYSAGPLVVNNATAYLDVQGQSDAFAGATTAIRSSGSNIDNSLRLYNNGQSRYVAMFGLTEDEYGEWAIGMGNKNSTYAYEYYLMSDPGPRNANTDNGGFGMNVGIGIEGNYPTVGDVGFNQHYGILIKSNTLDVYLNWSTNTDRHGVAAVQVKNSDRTVHVQNLIADSSVLTGTSYAAGPFNVNNTGSYLQVQGQFESSIGIAVNGVDNALKIVNTDPGRAVSLHGYTYDNFAEFLIGIGNANSAYTNEVFFVAQSPGPNNTNNGGFAPNMAFGMAGKGYSAFGDGGAFTRHFWLTVQSNTMDASFLFGTNSKYGPPALTISNASRTVNVTNLITSSYVGYKSNTWVNAFTNGMLNGDFRVANSNGLPVMFGFTNSVFWFKAL
jgi:hypothetical protein